MYTYIVLGDIQIVEVRRQFLFSFKVGFAVLHSCLSFYTITRQHDSVFACLNAKGFIALTHSFDATYRGIDNYCTFLFQNLLNQKLIRRIFLCLLCCFVSIFLVELFVWIYSEDRIYSGHSSVVRGSGHHLAVIIPYRDRKNELHLLLPHLHRFLVRQKVGHSFFVVNQVDEFRFNRGALLNAGFIESSEIEKDNRIILSSHYPDGDKHFFRSSDYVALHDVDLLPLDPNIRYTWPGREGPYHPIPAPFHPRYYWYAKYFGGVLIITREQFARVNGMSNSFWGWGAEDDEFRGRVIRARYVISSPKSLPMGMNAFRSIHNAKLHARDSSTYYDPRVRRLISAAHGGLSSTNYTVVSRDILRAEDIVFAMINVRLKCNMPLDLCRSNITADHQAR
ncbi:Beta 14 galactosyltransferase 7 [Fasciolopsis buskii]|uniref:Beta-1,4-galactosyltransferase n=1 Tax=Fasciolopsis buskii TaxID=27845 RepID=A0A8E0VJ44_9TREM|nr:Beta 14 galactosyltransferase 7 [Fasciolopsis buski]